MNVEFVRISKLTKRERGRAPSKRDFPLGALLEPLREPFEKEPLWRISVSFCARALQASKFEVQEPPRNGVNTIDEFDQRTIV